MNINITFDGYYLHSNYYYTITYNSTLNGYNVTIEFNRTGAYVPIYTINQ
jgi:hypothetical protein